MPKNNRKKGSTSLLTKIIIGVLAFTMLVPVLASLLQVVL